MIIRIAIVAACVLIPTSAAPAAPPPIEAYGRLPAVEHVTLSPSGDTYALVTVDGAARKLFVSTTGNKPIAAFDVGDAKVRGLNWAGDDYLLVATSKTYNLGLDFGFNHEIDQVRVMNLKTQKTYWAMAAGGGRNLGIWGHVFEARVDGRWYGYFPTLTLQQSGGGEPHLIKGTPDLYRVDLQTGAAIRFAEAPDDDPRQWWIDPAGDIAAQADYDVAHGRWTLRGTSRTLTLATLSDPFGSARIVGQGRTPGSVVYASVDADGAQQIDEIGTAPGSIARPIFSTRSVNDLLKDRETGLLLGATFEDKGRESELFSPLYNARVEGARKAFPGESTELISWNEDFSRLVMFTDGPQDSGTYWMVDIKTGQASEVGRAYPQVKDAEVAPNRLFAYRAADGLALEGVLTLPPGKAAAKNLPMIVLPHGGPAAHDDQHFDWWAQALASRGYAVFQPNFRGSTGYGPALATAGYGEWGRKMQTDVSDGLAALVAEGVVDRNRACIVGGSYGGYVALAGVTLQHGLYRCAVSMAGISDLPAMLTYETDHHGPSTGETRYWHTFIGDIGLAERSPVRLASSADAPILLIHGKDDTIVQPAQSEAMQRALAAAGKPAEYVSLDGEDHWLSREATRVAMLKAVDAFVEKYNPPN